MTMTAFVLTLLVALGVHRAWNFEDIFAPIRVAMRRVPWMKAAWCPACNAFWIAVASVLWVTFAPEPERTVFAYALAAYPLLRVALWISTNAPSILLRSTDTLPQELIDVVATQPPAVVPAARATAEPAKPGCSTCSGKKAAALTANTEAMQYESRVVILTALTSFPSSYSVASVVLDQARMLARDPKRLVQVWVMEGTDVRQVPFSRSNIKILPIVPHVPWREDVVEPEAVAKLVNGLREHLLNLGNAKIITHDLLFISHFVSFAAAIHQLGAMKAFGWLHVCHSAASKDRSSRAPSVRVTLPPKHRLICLNEADADHLAAHYATSRENVVVVPNARDITAFGRCEPHAEALIDRYRLTEADVVQVFPVSGTRMEAKGVPTLISIFGQLTKIGLSTRLVLVNAHSNSDEVRTRLSEYRKMAREAGLATNDFIITSEDFVGSAADGLPLQAVHDLFQVSNLFVMPSISEAASLTMLEAALSGCLIVTNESLHTLRDFISAPGCIRARFGSVREPGDTSNHEEIAEKIAQALAMSLMNRAKRDVLRRYSFRAVTERLNAAVGSTPSV